MLFSFLLYKKCVIQIKFYQKSPFCFIKMCPFFDKLLSDCSLGIYIYYYYSQYPTIYYSFHSNHIFPILLYITLYFLTGLFIMNLNHYFSVILYVIYESPLSDGLFLFNLLCYYYYLCSICFLICVLLTFYVLIICYLTLYFLIALSTTLYFFIALSVAFYALI